ncbi:MAG: hypothetical protein ACT4PL_11495 [Phycisphaerales bacterium]
MKSTGSTRMAMIGFGSALAALALCASAGMAQSKMESTEAKPAAPTAAAPRTGNVQKDTLLRMQKPVTVELNDTKLEDIFAYITRETGAELEIMWKTDNDEGFDKEQQVSISVKSTPAIDMLDKLFEKLEGGTRDNSWQMADGGAMQIGMKKRLNKYKRIEIYDINDLLFVLPIYDNAPQIDLNQVLQQSKGGGSQSPFKDNNKNQRDENNTKTKEDRAKDLQDLIINTVENEQWLEGGGEGASLRYYQGNFIVNGADYMHRALNGYRWWPSFKSSSGASGARRYVSLTPATGIAKAEIPFRTFAVPSPR